MEIGNEGHEDAELILQQAQDDGKERDRRRFLRLRSGQALTAATTALSFRPVFSLCSFVANSSFVAN